MDYTILRKIERPIGFQTAFSRHYNFQLPKSPALDFVNPGLAQINRNFEFYVPLTQHHAKDNFRKEKRIEGEDTVGSGQANSEEDEAPKVQTEINEILDNLNKGVKRQLSSDVYEAFQRPKISRLILDTKSTKNPSTKSSTATSKEKSVKSSPSQQTQSQGQLIEPGVIPSQIFAQSFVSKTPSDERFIQNTLHKIVPSSSIDANKIYFNLEKWDAANIYLIQDTLIEVTVKIVTDAGVLPEKTKSVSVANNILHSMFESVRLILNDIPITLSGNHYPYKAYVTNLLSYDSLVKLSQLTLQGWSADYSSHMGASTSNSGFQQRSCWFRKKYDITEDFRPEGKTFIGRLQHDLIACETGLPPGTKIQFELVKADPKFCLLVPAGDSTAYRLKLESVFLYVPVGVLSVSAYNELSQLMSRKEDSDIIIHYRRVEIRPFTIVKSTENWYSENIFSDGDIPCRIVLFFVESTAKSGSYDTNPFNCQRKWEVKKTASTLIQESNERNLEKKVALLEQKLAEYINKSTASTSEPEPGPSTSRGKRAAPKTKPQPSTTTTADLTAEATWLMKQFLIRNNWISKEVEEESDDENSETASNPSNSNRLQDLGAEKKFCFIKKITCTLNGNPIDQLDDAQTLDDCPHSYYRLFAGNGLLNAPFTNSVTYDDFLNGYFYQVYDFSTSGRSGTNNVVPTVRIGHLRFQVQFSEAIPVELTAMMYCEFPSTLYITKSGKIITSYSTKCKFRPNFVKMVLTDYGAHFYFRGSNFFIILQTYF